MPLLVLQKINNLSKYPPRFLYRKQVKIVFPMHILNRYVGCRWNLPDGYLLRSPVDDSDTQPWEDLLNSDLGFGPWTQERVKSDILRYLIAPDAASLLFYKDRLVGCCNTYDCSTPKKKIGKPMWLIIDEDHRGRGLGRIVYFRTLAFFARERYQKVVGFTDPCRLTALRFYLSEGYLPAYDSLYSVIHWWKIKHRLQSAPLRVRQQNKS